ncbi:hypothetical protein ABPG74_006783 [Tetrahymena malaccensis]
MQKISILITLVFLSCFACQKSPVYLSIEVDKSDVNPQLSDFLKQSFQQLLLKYPTDQQVITKDLNSLSKSKPQAPWKNPSSIHTTVLYIGSDKSKLDTEYYKQFKVGKQVQLESTTFIYVPGKIICSPVFPQGVLIENTCPHMTLMVANWKPVQCNSVLEAIFTQNGALKSEYENKFFQEPSNVMLNKLSKVEIDGETVDVYVVKANKGNQKYLNFQGETKYSY